MGATRKGKGILPSNVVAIVDLYCSPLLLCKLGTNQVGGRNEVVGKGIGSRNTPNPRSIVSLSDLYCSSLLLLCKLGTNQVGRRYEVVGIGMEWIGATS